MLSLSLKRVIRANPERVFRAWTNAEDLAKWHCPIGMTVSHALCVPEVGGRFSVNMVGEDGNNHRAVGTYLELEPPSKVRFTWDWEEGGDTGANTEVTVKIASLNDSECEVTLTHERFESAEGRDSHSEGWTGALTNLANYLEESE
ncbi:MAG TPA: SRPBCC domain-containing protein [Fimbriimonas sp.]|nr:SRPBCC domain-containing protein [Fimbriimonas sp.]